jgi:hypothetical protein
MVEYHVDCCHLFQDRMNQETKFGGELSVCKDPQEKALIDECIFKQYTMSTKSWVGPNGDTVPVPKDDGQGIMISAFQSREFGFGLDLTPDLLQEVNVTRQGKSYEDSKAAISKRGNAAKQPLTSTPFVIKFKYGANNDGYWAYEHMVLQLEDCIDVLRCLYPQYDVLFMFDHSCGHDRQREDGLNVKNMSKNYGGKQKCTSLMKKEKGFLGQFSRILNPGDVQSMVFMPGDEGPF